MHFGNKKKSVNQKLIEIKKKTLHLRTYRKGNEIQGIQKINNIKES